MAAAVPIIMAITSAASIGASIASSNRADANARQANALQAKNQAMQNKIADAQSAQNQETIARQNQMNPDTTAIMAMARKRASSGVQSTILTGKPLGGGTSLLGG